MKFTNEGDIIYVNLEEKNTDSGREFIVSVKDTGTGIDPEIFPRLFTKFATKSDRGTGLRFVHMQKYCRSTWRKDMG